MTERDNAIVILKKLMSDAPEILELQRLMSDMPGFLSYEQL